MCVCVLVNYAKSELVSCLKKGSYVIWQATGFEWNSSGTCLKISHNIDCIPLGECFHLIDFVWSWFEVKAYPFKNLITDLKTKVIKLITWNGMTWLNRVFPFEYFQLYNEFTSISLLTMVINGKSFAWNVKNNQKFLSCLEKSLTFSLCNTIHNKYIHTHTQKKIGTKTKITATYKWTTVGSDGRLVGAKKNLNTTLLIIISLLLYTNSSSFI